MTISKLKFPPVLNYRDYLKKNRDQVEMAGYELAKSGGIKYENVTINPKTDEDNKTFYRNYSINPKKGLPLLKKQWGYR